MLDPLITLSHLAAVTTKVRLATGILLAALRRPVVLSKMLSTIDQLSYGRLDIGVGVGWHEEEYLAAGLSFASRGRLLNLSLEVCQTLWRNQAATYQSEELSFTRLHQMPKPVQQGGVPIWVSGTINANSMDRLAKFGVGWIPWGDDAKDIEGGIVRMRAAMTARGRDPEEIGIVGSLPVFLDGADLDIKKTMASVPKQLESGVTDFRMGLVSPKGPFLKAEYLGELVDAFRSASK